jgi:hypothetical protein
MQFHRIRRITSAHAALSLHTHNSTPKRASMISSSGQPIRHRASINAMPQQQHPRADRSRSPSPAPPEWSEDMRPTRSCLALLLGLMFFAGLAGCGSASSDNAPSLESRANVGGPPLSKQGLSPGNNPLTPATQAASALPLTLGNKTGAIAGKGTDPVGDRSQAVPVSSSTKPADALDPLVVPEWMAKDLDSPDVGTRLRALDTWVQSAPPGADDPLIFALDNKDERVRARAMELIEENWARAADSEQ